MLKDTSRESGSCLGCEGRVSMGLIQATPGEIKLGGRVSYSYKITGLVGMGEMISHSFKASAERMADIAACCWGRDRHRL